MDTNTVWQMIEDANQRSADDIEEQKQILISELANKSEDEIGRFYYIYNTLLNEAYTVDLWDACVFIRCSGGEQMFINFRAWLIAQGRDVFYAAINDPDSLARIVSQSNRHDIGYETFSYIAYEAYEKKTGHEEDHFTLPPSPSLGGGHFSHETELPQKFPKLAAKLGKCY